MRSGDEPRNARSPLRMRLALAGGGLVVSAATAVGFAMAGQAVPALGFATVAVLATVNVVVVVHRIRQGAHYQPGRAVPPYRPAEPTRPSTDTARPAPERGHGRGEPRRVRLYLILMGLCLALIVTAWTMVRLVSLTAAEVMTVLAMLIPPVAVVVANAGWSQPASEGSELSRRSPVPPSRSPSNSER